MMQTNRRLKPCKDQGTDQRIAQHSVTVIETAVDRVIITSVQSRMQVVEVVFGSTCFSGVYRLVRDV